MKQQGILKSKLKKEEILRFFSNNKVFVVLSGVLLFGVFLGAIFSNATDNGTLNRINALFLNNFKIRTTEPAFSVFVSSLSSIFFFIIISFFMGLSLWGCMLIPLVPLMRGFCIGIFQSYLYETYGLNGICYQMLVLLPGIFLSSVAILLMSREAMRLSHNFSSFMLFRENGTYEKKEDIRMYLLRTGCVLIISVFSSIIDLVFNFAFLRFFSF